MKLQLYKNNSNVDFINKKLTLLTTFDIWLKQSQNILKLDIPIKSETDLIALKVDYAYIDVLKRYYFIDSIEPYPNGVYLLHLEIDVLQTYQTEILNAKGVTTNASIEVKTDVCESDVKLIPDDVTYLIVTIGKELQGGSE